jgi:ribonuclease HI
MKQYCLASANCGQWEFRHCILKTDSKVIASQIEKECTTRDETLERYLAAIRRMENFFKGFIVEHIERAKNTEVDELAKAAAKKATLPLDVFFSSFRRLLRKKSRARAKNGKCHARRRLLSTDHGIPPSQL